MHVIAATILIIGTAQLCYFAMALAAHFFGRNVVPMGESVWGDALGSFIVFAVFGAVYGVITLTLYDRGRL